MGTTPTSARFTQGWRAGSPSARARAEARAAPAGDPEAEAREPAARRLRRDRQQHRGFSIGSTGTTGTTSNSGSGSTSTLPATGSDLVWLALIGAGLLTLGAATALVARRVYEPTRPAGRGGPRCRGGIRPRPPRYEAATGSSAPTATSITARMKAGRSSGRREVTKFPSTTTSASVHSAPAFRRSSAIAGTEVAAARRRCRPRPEPSRRGR